MKLLRVFDRSLRGWLALCRNPAGAAASLRSALGVVAYV